MKLLKKQVEKQNKKQNSVSGILSLEEQVMELNQKLKDQDKVLRTKEKKINKKNQGQRNTNQVRGELVSNSSEFVNYQQQYNEASANLNKALDKIFEFESQVNTLEKERTLLALENHQFKQEIEVLNPIKPELEKLRGEKAQWEIKFAEMQKEYKSILSDKIAYEQNLKKLNE